MAALFGRNPRLLILTIILVLTGGYAAWTLLPRREDPAFVERWGLVLTPFPGAGSERVEALVTEPMEDALRAVRGVKKTASISRAGISMVTVTLADDITDVEPVWSLVRDRTRSVGEQLPEGVGSPRFDREEFLVYTAQIGLVWRGKGAFPHGVMARLAEELQREVRCVPGTAHTNRYGAPEEEVLVEVARQRLLDTGLTVAKLADQVRASDARVSAGTVRGSEQTLPLEVQGALGDLQRLREVTVSIGERGQSLRLEDLATIERGFRDPPPQKALIDGRQGVVVGARMADEVRGDRWAQAVRAAVSRFQSRLPPNVEAEVIFDQTRYTDERLGALMENLLLGGGLVIAIVLLLMGWRSTVLVTAALPLTLALVLIGLQVLGISLEQMSIVGLIMALGLLIDNAIVVVDELRHRMTAGLGPLEAIADTVKTLRAPLLGSTLTTIFALMPMVLLTGPTGDFVRSMAISLILALVLSLAVALTLLPALGTWLGKGRENPGTLAALADGGLRLPWVGQGYARLVRAAVEQPVVALVVALTLPAAGLIWSGALREQFFPASDRDQFQVQLNLTTQASLAETERAAAQAEKILRYHPEVERVYWFIGTSSPFFYYNMTSGRFRLPSFAQGIVQLRGSAGVSDLVRTVQTELDQGLPGAQTLALQFGQGPPLEAPIEMRILGPDLEILRETGKRIRSLMASVPGITHTRTTLGQGQPKLVLNTREDVVRARGLSNLELAQRLDQALEGVQAGALLDGTQQLPVRVRLRAEDRKALADVATLPLPRRGVEGAETVVTTLDALGEAELRPDWSEITRLSGTRSNAVRGFIPAGMLPGTVLAQCQEAMDAQGFRMPSGYRLEVGGESQERNAAMESLQTWALPLLLLLLATLVVSFRSFRCAAIVALVGAASVGLALASLRLFDYPLGFMALLGTVGLIGVAVNDAIVVLAGLREDPDAARSNREAIARVVVRCTRHVLATTLTTIFGFLPLVLAGGGFWPPLAVVISAGLAGATLLSLTLVPAVYVLVFPART